MVTLRIFYLQPLLKILKDRGLLSEGMQVSRVEQYIGVEQIDPFRLRDNYGQQYKAVIGLGEPNVTDPICTMISSSKPAS